MNYRMVGKYLSYLIWALGAFLLPCVLVGTLYGELRPTLSLLLTAGICALLGLGLFLLCRRNETPIYTREGYVVAGLGWVLVSLLGSLPFLFSGEIPSFADAWFESASGFTTTGASVLANVEALSHAILFWRSFTHWLGGIGVLVFILMVVRTKTGTGFSMHLLRAESAGPQIGKVLPKTRDSVQVIYTIYIGLSLINLFLLLLGGMPLFDALCTMFGTAGTGGFSIKNNSLAGYSTYLQAITTVFMLLFGVNFSLYYLFIKKQFKSFFKDEELRLYFGIYFFFTIIIVLTLFFTGYYPLGASIQNGSFTVSSIITTTGFAISDFDLWPEACRALLVVVMMLGSMAGSTAGGVKTARLLILLKTIRNGFHSLTHPRSVRVVAVNGQKVNPTIINGVFLYFSVYVITLVATFAFLSFEGSTLETSLTAAASCLNNVGPGLGLVGPSANYGLFSPISKLVLAFVMLLGRLEFFPLLLLFTPSTWRRQ